MLTFALLHYLYLNFVINIFAFSDCVLTASQQSGSSKALRMRLSLKLSCPAIECLAKSREGFLIQIVLVALFLTSCVSRASRIRSADLLGNPAADGDIALVGEDGETADVTADKGNVLIYHGGQLWSVCDDHWNDHAAAVVCRSLGYAGATGHTTQSFFGQPDYGRTMTNIQSTLSKLSWA